MSQSAPATACTIITPDYLGAAITLARSLQRHGSLNLAILVVDGTTIFDLTRAREFCREHCPGVTLHTLVDLQEMDGVEALVTRYRYRRDHLRWSLKSALSLFLLQEFEQVFYLDSDLHFCNPYEFLFDELRMGGILLTPHWRTIWPHEPWTANEFVDNLTNGIFNAGFVGTTRAATPFLKWWQTVCDWRCQKNFDQGLFDDQRYLDLVPVYFAEQCRVLQHRGCNLAIWNLRENVRTEVDDQVLINNKWPVVFFHATQELLLSYGARDPLLRSYIEPYLAEYQASQTLLVQHKVKITGGLEPQHWYDFP